ncbi:MAG: hypothetical protein WC641_08350 [Patescibacteria group bacterium]
MLEFLHRIIGDANPVGVAVAGVGLIAGTFNLLLLLSLVIRSLLPKKKWTAELEMAREMGSKDAPSSAAISHDDPVAYKKRFLDEGWREEIEGALVRSCHPSTP